jgi:vacuolar iron transporter family protein
LAIFTVAAQLGIYTQFLEHNLLHTSYSFLFTCARGNVYDWEMHYTIHQKASFLKDAVFSASDGLITTFAIVAGSVGADLSPNVIVILGFANLFADGFSMASGSYIGVKSEQEFEKAYGDKQKEGSPLIHGVVSFVSFVLIGFIPIIPYVFGMRQMFYLSMFFVALSMFGVGAIRSRFTKKNFFLGGLEMLFVGSIAASVAFLVGHYLQGFTD